MEIVNYFHREDRQALLDAIRGCDWSAASFLVKLLEQGTFEQTLGGWGELYLLMQGQELISFLTFTGQDAVRDPALMPWIGFVFTRPEHRGHRFAGLLLAHAEAEAARRGYEKVYIATDHVGLYEKYGYCYQEDRIDCWGDEMRVLYKTVR